MLEQPQSTLAPLGNVWWVLKKFIAKHRVSKVENNKNVLKTSQWRIRQKDFEQDGSALPSRINVVLLSLNLKKMAFSF